jgi:predicted DNA-binding transcriptional regulator YafY
MARIRFQLDVMERVRRERSWGLVDEKSGAEGTEVTLLDSSLECLTGWVLSFGSMAEALEPERLQELVAAEAAKVAAQYADVRQLVAPPCP